MSDVQLRAAGRSAIFGDLGACQRGLFARKRAGELPLWDERLDALIHELEEQGIELDLGLVRVFDHLATGYLAPGSWVRIRDVDADEVRRHGGGEWYVVHPLGRQGDWLSGFRLAPAQLVRAGSAKGAADVLSLEGSALDGLQWWGTHLVQVRTPSMVRAARAARHRATMQARRLATAKRMVTYWRNRVGELRVGTRVNELQKARLHMSHWQEELRQLA